MRGTILGYDAGAGVSVLRGEDGRRYAFAPPAWREQRPPRKGDLVDFEPRGERAEMVFLLVSPKDREKSGEPGTLLGAAARHPAVRSLLERPVLITSVLVLLACFAEAYRLGNDEVSLYAVPDLISGFVRSLDAMVGGTDDSSQPRLIAAILRFVLLLQLLLYAVPVLAARAAWNELAGRPALRVGRNAGLAAMILPIVLPLLVIVPVHLALLPSVDGTTIRLGGGGVEVPRQSFDVMRFYGTGTVLLLFSGLALWASATGRFQPLRGDRKAASASGAVLRNGPASFGPPSVRKEDAGEQMEMVLPSALQRRQQPGQRPHGAAAPAPAPDTARPSVEEPEEQRQAEAKRGGGMHWPHWPSRRSTAAEEGAPERPVAAEPAPPRSTEDSRVRGWPDEPRLERIEPDYLEAGEEPYPEEEPEQFEAPPRAQPRPEMEIRRMEPRPELQPQRPEPQPRPEQAPADEPWEPAPEESPAPAVDPRDWRRFEEDMEEPLLRRYVPREAQAEPEPEEDPASVPVQRGTPSEPTPAEPPRQASTALPSEAPETWQDEPEARDEWAQPVPEPEEPEAHWEEPQVAAEPAPEPAAEREEQPERGPAPARRSGRSDLDDLSMLANDLRSALESEIGRPSFSTRREQPAEPEERSPPHRPAQSTQPVQSRQPTQSRQPPFSTRDTSFGGEEGGLPARPYRPVEEDTEEPRRQQGRQVPRPQRRPRSDEPGPEGEQG